MKNRDCELDAGTTVFGEAWFDFCPAVPTHAGTSPIIHQPVRAGTSVGVNCGEADHAESKKDFRHKIALCRTEARETKDWLRMIAKAPPSQKTAARSGARGEGTPPRLRRHHPPHGPKPPPRPAPKIAAPLRQGPLVMGQHSFLLFPDP